VLGGVFTLYKTEERMIYKRQGKRIGELQGEVYRKAVSKSKHLFIKGNAWGIQAEILRNLPDETKIEIFEKEEMVLYSVTAKEFRDNCFYLEFKGHGLQAFLDIDNFDKGKLNTWAV
jgi:hypothetical protein